VSVASKKRSGEFLKVAGQFKLGSLFTEASHPITANLSEVARQDTAVALKLLFDVDDDVISAFRKFAESKRAGEIAGTIAEAVKSGGKIFFTGCGATGRLSILLDSIWRDFWHQQKDPGLENRAYSVMSGGDYALIKSVEGFEDFAAFGKKQVNDLGISERDVLFAITEGGETSFVIGTAWAGVEAGAKVYFVYNNPDNILCRHIERSREVILDSRIEKINLTTGPMAIAGSTRMQATTIQLCVMLTILEMVVQKLSRRKWQTVPGEFLKALEELHAGLKTPETLAQLAGIVALEESVYRRNGKVNYFAGRFGIDVLTDTTERSPTYCTPSFRKFDDAAASDSWAFLFVPKKGTRVAWRHILKRPPRCLEWSEGEIRRLVPGDNISRTVETIRKIGRKELIRFKIGLDGLPYRVLGRGDCAMAVVSGAEKRVLMSRNKPFSLGLQQARAREAQTAAIYFCQPGGEQMPEDKSLTASAIIILPQTDFLLDGIARVAVKMVMNAISTCTMVRLGRVMGNMMIYVVPSNLKLIDRATRYVNHLTGLPYGRANELLFEVIEYIEPRMKSDRAYPPVVGMAVVRARKKYSNKAAETFLQDS
jgi:N-acetylmuramic acid 6-phosphate etherase